ncbi:MAG TPA: ADOP family duplicated permease [Myxococcales bacterium]
MHAIRVAVRQLRRRPLFTALTLAVLSLGLGAALTVVEIADTVVLRPLPFADEGRLVTAWQTDIHGGGSRITVAGADFVDWQREAKVFETMAAVSARGFNVALGDRPERIEGAIVSSDFFALLGTTPLLGQPSLDAGTRTAVLSENLWRARFGSDPNIVGRTISIDGEPVTVSAVAREAFRYPASAALWVSPRSRVPEHPTYPIDPEHDRTRHYLTVLARLRPGVTLSQAQAALSVVQARLVKDHPDEEEGIGAQLVPLREQLYGKALPLLWVLFAVAALLFFVAWVNAAQLFLARAAARAHEVAVRVALGATRGSLWKLFFGESALLSLVAAAIGVVIAAQAAPVLVARSPQGSSLPLPRLSFIVILAAAALAAACALSLGALAALNARRANALRETAIAGHARLRRALLVFEMALSLVLLLGTGLLLRSFLRVLQVDPGFSSSSVLAADLPLPHLRYPDRASQARFAKDLLRELRSNGRVDAAGLVSRLPLSPSNTIGDLTVPGREKEAFPTELRLASDGYFEALRFPLREGRTFTAQDLEPGAAPVAVVNEAAARRAFPGRSPIGERILVWGETVPAEIVGVVGNVRHAALDEDPRPEAFRPLGAVGWPNLALAVRGKGALEPIVREAVSRVDSQVPIVRPEPMDERVEASLSLRRFALLLLSAMALATSLLAAAGIYGVTSYLVAQRTRELGVRQALGATPRKLVADLVRESFLTVALGAGFGIVAGAFAAPLLRGYLFGVPPIDPATFVLVPLALGALAILATFAAAARATRVDPAEALRAL